MRMWSGNNHIELRRKGWFCVTLRVSKITDVIKLLDFIDEDRPGQWYVQLYVREDENEYYFEDRQTAVEFALRFA